jgi:hypothetical protein
MLKLKKASYPQFGYPIDSQSSFHEIVYIVKDNICYFMSIEQEGSTTMAMESVILSIANKERKPFEKLRYIEICCLRGGFERRPGEYSVEEIIFKPGIKSTMKDGKLYCQSMPQELQWRDTELPDDIYPLFKDLIGPDLSKMYHEILDETEGIICVCDKQDRYFFVDIDGNPITKEKFKDITPFNGGEAMVQRQNGKWAKIDTKGRMFSVR